MTRIAVLDDYQGQAIDFADWDRLDAPVVFFGEHMTGEKLVAELQGFDVVVVTRERTPFPREVIEGLPELRLIVTTGMVNSVIDYPATRERGIVVSGTDGVPTSTNELTWAILLAGVKNLAREDRAMRAGQWQLTIAGDLAGQRLGLIGLGRLGQEMLPVARAFGMKISAWSPNLTPERAAAAGVDFATREELFSTADIVSVHMRLTESTRGMIGAAELDLMRPGALLVNSSRGPLIDGAALLAALQSGRIDAALDVYDVEPLPAGHPLTQLDNVVLSPHMGYVSLKNFRRSYEDALVGIELFLAGTPQRVLNAG